MDSEIDEDSSSAINKAYTQNSLLVSTNDSRIRLCQLDDYSVITKYKGNQSYPTYLSYISY